MSLILTTPVLKDLVGNIFHVSRFNIDCDRLQANFQWQIKDANGAVLFTDNATLKDTAEMIDDISVQHNDFSDWYNLEYKTHADLVSKVAALAGFSGEFQSEGLI